MDTQKIPTLSQATTLDELIKATQAMVVKRWYFPKDWTIEGKRLKVVAFENWEDMVNHDKQEREWEKLIFTTTVWGMPKPKLRAFKIDITKYVKDFDPRKYMTAEEIVEQTMQSSKVPLNDNEVGVSLKEAQKRIVIDQHRKSGNKE